MGIVAAESSTSNCVVISSYDMVCALSPALEPRGTVACHLDEAVRAPARSTLILIGDTVRFRFMPKWLYELLPYIYTAYGLVTTMSRAQLKV